MLACGCTVPGTCIRTIGAQLGGNAQSAAISNDDLCVLRHGQSAEGGWVHMGGIYHIGFCGVNSLRIVIGDHEDLAGRNGVRACRKCAIGYQGDLCDVVGDCVVDCVVQVCVELLSNLEDWSVALDELRFNRGIINEAEACIGIHGEVTVLPHVIPTDKLIPARRSGYQSETLGVRLCDALVRCDIGCIYCVCTARRCFEGDGNVLLHRQLDVADRDRGCRFTGCVGGEFDDQSVIGRQGLAERCPGSNTRPIHFHSTTREFDRIVETKQSILARSVCEGQCALLRSVRSSCTSACGVGRNTSLNGIVGICPGCISCTIGRQVTVSSIDVRRKSNLGDICDEHQHNQKK